MSLFDESIPMLLASKLAYSFADIAKAARTGKINLIIPDGFPTDCLQLFKDESIDFRDTVDGDGMPFNQIASLLVANKENLDKVFLEDDLKFIMSIVRKLQSAEDQDLSSDSFFLETFRSIQQKVSCVYGILKDKNKKQIIITFRGSLKLDGGTRDWRTNFYARAEELRTPKAIQDKMEGKLKERVLVHKGFYNYLFNNKRVDGDQKYDQILEDIRPLIEEGYKIYVTGHSLGGALATMAAFKIAGENKPWIPKPITCISYASPFVGSAGFRAAHVELEKGGHLRHLRVTNDNDIVPAVSPCFLNILRFRPLKHVGINLRLKDGSFEITHPSGSGTGLKNALKNSLFKPLLYAKWYHLLTLHYDRMLERFEVPQQYHN